MSKILKENALGENQRFYFNGKEINDKKIKLEGNGTINKIEVIL